MTGNVIVVLYAAPAVALASRGTFGPLTPEDIKIARAAIGAALPGIVAYLQENATHDLTLVATIERLADEVSDETVARP